MAFLAPTNENGWIMFISGLIWIPYSLLFLYLFHEQYSRRRFPQYLIILSLACGCMLRCFWFVGSDEFKSSIPLIFINRVAILFQFTGVSLLLMMWLRILKVSVQASTANSFSSSPALGSQPSVMPSSNPSSSVFSSPSIVPEFLIRSKLVEPSIWTAHLIVAIVVNIIVWVFIILTIALSLTIYSEFYNINILLVAILCFLEGVFILGVGINTGMRISQELSPVFLTWRLTPQVQKTRYMRLRAAFSGIYYFLFESSHQSRLHGQSLAVRKLVIVSSIISFFFLCRSLAFAYRIFISP